MKKSGFTLIELMVVISIIGLLTTITLPRFKDMRREAEIAQIQANTKNIRTAIAMWEVEHGPHMNDRRESKIFEGSGNLNNSFSKYYSKSKMPYIPNTKRNWIFITSSSNGFTPDEYIEGVIDGSIPNLLGWIITMENEIYPIVDEKRYGIKWNEF